MPPAARKEDGISETGGSGVLTLDLAALRHNYKMLQAEAQGAEVAAVVKADAYGLGADNIAPALVPAGCRLFFVAQLAEARALRACLPKNAPAGCIDIAILNDVLPQEAAAAAQEGFIPVLNSLESVRLWAQLCGKQGRRLPAMLQCDSGMARLGLDRGEIKALQAEPQLLAAMDVKAILSHLACGDDEQNAMNAAQAGQFAAAAAGLAAAAAGSGARLSLAASCGLALGADFRLDIVRPGLALYGVIDGAELDKNAKAQQLARRLRPVVKLEARFLRIGALQKGETVGYGAIYKAARTEPIAAVSAGYADGWPRSLGNKGAVYYRGARLPILGRISMDCLVVSLAPLAQAGLALPQRGEMAELIGAHQSLAQVAREAGFIPYEILTALGRRYQKRLINN